MTTDTLSHLPRRKFWGWGNEAEQLTPEEEQYIRSAVQKRAGDDVVEVSAPSLDEFTLEAPRHSAPAGTLGEQFSQTPYDRLSHTYGKSYPDIVRMLMRQAPSVPDWVAFPRNENDVTAILDWASGARVAVVPFGGGSSVVGGVECTPQDGNYRAVVSMDTQYLNRVLQIDPTSRAALIEGGIYGPALEDALRPHELTLRYFPQSFQFSTLGGWLATRGGGHYATLYTHIDDMLESARMVTPTGVWDSRRLPGSGAGPSPDRMVLGSEGTLGVITQAWMRLQDRPRFRASTSVEFASMDDAVNATRLLSQSALFPTNCRLLDPAEAHANGVSDGDKAVLVLGFESANHPVDAWLQHALELVGDCHGEWDKEAVAASLKGAAAGSGGGQEHRQGASGQWRNAFLRMPYYRDLSVAMGSIVDTFETAVTWDGFDAMYHGVRERVGNAIERITGAPARVSCRFTHLYPDGPAPYFSWNAIGSRSGDLASCLAQWREIKEECNQAVTDFGGTVTHHHAVGRDHLSGYRKQMPPRFMDVMKVVRGELDPAGIMNPGVLADE